MLFKEIINPSFQTVSEKLREYVTQKKLPNVLVLVHQRGQMVYCEKMGMSDHENNKPLEWNQIYRLASMTKSIVSVGSLLLYEEGKFSLDDPLSKFIPKASQLRVFTGVSNDRFEVEELKRPVTMLDVLTHTGGFVNDWSPNHPLTKKYNEFVGENRTILATKSLKEVVEEFLDIPLRYQPGKRFTYGLSTSILGRIIEIISGQTLDIFMQERVFDKLEMKDTGFYVPRDKISRLIPIYTHNQEGELIKQSNSPAMGGSLEERPIYLSGGGGLVSTLSDFLTFSLMLLNRGKHNDSNFLGEETINLMMKDHILRRGIEHGFKKSVLPNVAAYAEDYGFGLGVQVKVKGGNIPKGVNGFCGAYTTDYWVDPKNGVIGILLSQYWNWTKYRIYNEFRELTYQALNNY